MYTGCDLSPLIGGSSLTTGNTRSLEFDNKNMSSLAAGPSPGRVLSVDSITAERVMGLAVNIGHHGFIQNVTWHWKGLLKAPCPRTAVDSPTVEGVR